MNIKYDNDIKRSNNNLFLTKRRENKKERGRDSEIGNDEQIKLKY
jgi:hypothetical protein